MAPLVNTWHSCRDLFEQYFSLADTPRRHSSLKARCLCIALRDMSQSASQTHLSPPFEEYSRFSRVHYIIYKHISVIYKRRSLRFPLSLSLCSYLQNLFNPCSLFNAPSPFVFSFYVLEHKSLKNLSFLYAKRCFLCMFAIRVEKSLKKLSLLRWAVTAWALMCMP